MLFARSALLSTVLLYVIASQRTLLRVSHRGNSLNVRLLPDMVAQAVTASAGRKRFLSQDDLDCERCFTQDGMVYVLKAIGVQIVESTCSVDHNSILNYLKKAAGLLGIEFDCEPDVKIILDPIPSMVQASATCTGGNPVLGTNDPGSSCQRYLEVIHLGAAWRAARSAKLKLKDVVLAVIDTGVDTTHPDLVNQFWRNPADGSIGFNFAKNNTNVTDVLRHGTHCAGSAVAQTNNCIGIAGVANIEGPPPKVKLMVLKIFDDSGVGLLSYSLRALNFAVENGATVSSHSYRWYNTSELQKAAYKKAAAAGHIAVAAAGNEALDLEKNRTYPCCLAEEIPSMLCVAASTSNPTEPVSLAGFSNAGFVTKVAAPGVDIYSTVPGGLYFKTSGTSMSTPIVAGVAALLATLGLEGQDITSTIVKSRTAGIPNPFNLSHIGEIDVLEAVNIALTQLTNCSSYGQ